MERIKEAIAKAKQARDGGHQVSPTTPQEPKTQLATGSPDYDIEETPIVYNQTRVVELDFEHLEANRIITLDNEDPNSISFDILRTQVLAKMEANNWRTLAITSPTP
ncbi:MAG: protein tyrosine kinase, partial [Alphaproteobacteria bacterium]